MDGWASPNWSEQTYISLMERGDLPTKGDPDVMFEHVIAVVENWVSYENTSEAPIWPERSSQGATVSPDGALQYDTSLDRQPYNRIRATPALMLCIPTGPEAAHCIAMDPSTNRPVELLRRGS
jgi:hypothetical protein